MGDRPSRFDRRTFLSRGAAALSLGAAASTMLDACSSSSGSSTPTVLRTSGAVGVSKATPRHGGTVTIGVTSEIDGFDPASSHFDATGLSYANAVFDSLTRITRDGGWTPYLAQSVAPSPDLTVWTITLRPGITFHDGSPLNAGVALANFEALKVSALTAQALGPVVSAAQVDDMTYTITLSEPVFAFPYAMATQLGYVVALSQLNGGPNAAAHPIGTGPFKYVDWVPNDHFSVERNPDYWRAGLPYLDGITFKPIVGDEQREDTLRSGGIDAMASDDPHAIKDLESDPSFQQVNNLTTTVGEPDMDFIILNCAKDPTNDLTVRQALAYATDVDTLNKVFGLGLTKPQTSLFNPGSPFRPADNGYPTFDLARAKQLVAQAAPNHGGTVSLTLGTIPEPRDIQVCQAIVQMWEQAGMQVNLTEVQQVTFIDNLVEGQFQAYTDEQFASPDPDLNYVWWSPTTANPPIALNFARNKDETLEHYLQQGRTSSDPTVRAQAYQMVDTILARDLPYIWLGPAAWSFTTTTRVQNFNNPVAPDGTLLQGFYNGVFDPTPIWV